MKNESVIAKDDFLIELGETFRGIARIEILHDRITEILELNKSDKVKAFSIGLDVKWNLHIYGLDRTIDIILEENEARTSN